MDYEGLDQARSDSRHGLPLRPGLDERSGSVMESDVVACQGRVGMEHQTGTTMQNEEDRGESRPVDVDECVLAGEPTTADTVLTSITDAVWQVDGSQAQVQGELTQEQHSVPGLQYGGQDRQQRDADEGSKSRADAGKRVNMWPLERMNR